MCILFIYIDFEGKSKYRLIVINNRDENFGRPTLNANFWEKCNKSDEGIKTVGGIDSLHGGTWLAVSSKKSSKDDITIKLASLLNIVDPNARSPASKSRGDIVSEFVTRPISIHQYNNSLYDVHHQYSTFNFVSVELQGSKNSIIYQSNSPRHVINLSEEKNNENFFGFGNSPYEKPLHKVTHGLSLFKEIVHKFSTEDSQENFVENLMNLLKDDKKCWPDDELRPHLPEWAEHLSSINVRVPNECYGTRTRTVILVDHKNKVDYFEDTMESLDPEGPWKRTHLVL